MFTKNTMWKYICYITKNYIYKIKIIKFVEYSKNKYMILWGKNWFSLKISKPLLIFKSFKLNFEKHSILV